MKINWTDIYNTLWITAGTEKESWKFLLKKILLSPPSNSMYEGYRKLHVKSSHNPHAMATLFKEKMYCMQSVS